MVMKTPEKQVLPIAPSYPDLSALQRWSADLTRTLAQNLASIARRANAMDLTGLGPFTVDSITVTGTLTGNTDILLTTPTATTAHAFAANNSAGAGAIRVGTGGNTTIYFDTTHNFQILKVAKANIADLSFTSPTSLFQVDNTGATQVTDGTFRVQGNTTSIPLSNVLTISMSDDSAAATDFRIEKLTASPAAGDVVSRIISQANNSVGTVVGYVVEHAVIEDATSGSEDSSWNIFTYVAGTSARRIRVRNGVDLNGTADPGAGSLSLNALVMNGALSGVTTGAFSSTVNIQGALTLGNTTNADYFMEIGYTGGTNRTAGIDFHSSATAVDYDVRVSTNSNGGVTGAGTLVFLATGGLSLNGPVQSTIDPHTAPTLNAAGNAQAIGSGAEVTLSNHSGLLIIVDHTNGAAGLVLVGGGSVYIIGGSAQFVNSSTPSTSQVGIYFSSPTYRVKNGFAVSHTIGMNWLTARNSV